MGPWISRNLIITQDLHQFGPAHTTEPPGHKPLVVNVIVVGPFKEEEEGTGVASDVVKARCRVRIWTPQVIQEGIG